MHHNFLSSNRNSVCLCSRILLSAFPFSIFLSPVRTHPFNIFLFSLPQTFQKNPSIWYVPFCRLIPTHSRYICILALNSLRWPHEGLKRVSGRCIIKWHALNQSAFVCLFNKLYRTLYCFKNFFLALLSDPKQHMTIQREVNSCTYNSTYSCESKLCATW